MQLERSLKEKVENEDRVADDQENNVEPGVRYSLRAGSGINKEQLSCIFCEQIDDEVNLHQPTTLNIDEKVRKAAAYLCDHDLISKLSGGDMVDLEARYHVRCLSNFYRKYEAALKSNEPPPAERKDSSKWFESVALAELFEYIEQTLKQTRIILLPLAELHTLYVNRLADLCNLHVPVNKTRLKDKIEAHFPQLQVSKSGRNIIFSRDAVEYRKADEDWDTDARAFVRVTNIVRRYIFEQDSTDQDQGDQNDQESSVPQKLWAIALNKQFPSLRIICTLHCL